MKEGCEFVACCFVGKYCDSDIESGCILKTLDSIYALLNDSSPSNAYEGVTLFFKEVGGIT